MNEIFIIKGLVMAYLLIIVLMFLVFMRSSSMLIEIGEKNSENSIKEILNKFKIILSGIIVLSVSFLFLVREMLAAGGYLIYLMPFVASCVLASLSVISTYFIVGLLKAKLKQKDKVIICTSITLVAIISLIYFNNSLIFAN